MTSVTCGYYPPSPKRLRCRVDAIAQGLNVLSESVFKDKELLNQTNYYDYILNTPNFVVGIGFLFATANDNPRIFLVSAGSMTPSSHNLADE